MSSPFQAGDDADRASMCGRLTSNALMMGQTRSADRTPTWTWMPQMIICRPHHWVRLMISE